MSIEQRILGRTGLTVSLLGLGAGGNSRLGLSTGQTEEHDIESLVKLDTIFKFNILLIHLLPVAGLLQH
jgi:hypothetical protein